MPRRLASIATVLAIGAGTAAIAHASAGPVGPLPPGPQATVVTRAGEFVAVALPHRSRASWRVARAINAKVLHQVSEADVGANVVLVFKTTHPGSATIAFALTRGETSKALESRTFKVRVQ